MEADLHIDSVIDKLNVSKNFQVIRIDPTRPLKSISIESGSDSFLYQGVEYLISDVTTVFCRYALENNYYDEVPIKNFTINENISLLNGILLNVDRKRWINFPWSESIAEGKLYPIGVAKKIGIDVPFYFVTNDLNEIKKNCDPLKKYIIKMLSDTSIAKQQGEYKHIPNLNEYEAIYTNDFDYKLLLNKNIDETPMLIQEKIIGDFEWRVVVVDEHVYASKLTLTGEAVDSRLINKRLESNSTLNSNLKEKILDLCKTLNLRFSTFDLIEHKSKYYLIDINPSGNWLWQTYEPINLPIVDSLIQSITRK